MKYLQYSTSFKIINSSTEDLRRIFLVEGNLFIELSTNPFFRDDPET